jgi:hypothetical protein
VALIRVDVLLLGAAANRQTRQDKTRHDKTGAPSVTCQHGLSAPHAMSVQFSSGSRSHKRRATCKKPPLFVSVPYVCPEPVLVKRSFPHRNNWLKKSVSQLFLCLSRACLGKMIVLMYKWLKKSVFRTHHPGVVARELWKRRALQEKRATIFKGVFQVSATSNSDSMPGRHFVPSLS